MLSLSLGDSFIKQLWIGRERFYKINPTWEVITDDPLLRKLKTSHGICDTENASARRPSCFWVYHRCSPIVAWCVRDTVIEKDSLNDDDHNEYLKTQNRLRD